MDKRQPYDFDTRIHLLALGPGIKPGSTWAQPATQVDMAPTFLGLAGLPKPATMDGKSIVPLLMAAESSLQQQQPVSTVYPLLASTRQHLAELGESHVAKWRQAAFIEYYFNADNDKCMQNCTYPTLPWPSGGDYTCTDLDDNRVCWGGKTCTTNCYATENIENNFIVLRSMSGSRFGNSLYAEFETGDQGLDWVNFTNISFVEYFELDADPWMMDNKARDRTAPIDALHAESHAAYNCRGDACP